jgi:hypothetical protein
MELLRAVRFRISSRSTGAGGARVFLPFLIFYERSPQGACLIRSRICPVTPFSPRAANVGCWRRSVARCDTHTRLDQARRTGLPEIGRFCDGLLRDAKAVIAAVVMPWSKRPGAPHRQSLTQGRSLICTETAGEPTLAKRRGRAMTTRLGSDGWCRLLPQTLDRSFRALGIVDRTGNRRP